MKLKICGIRDIDILKYTCDMGVNFAGFIMPDDSPRKISNNFISSLENFNFKDTLPVFVFVNPKVTSTMRSRAVSGVVVAIISAPRLHAGHLEDIKIGLHQWL